MFIFIGGITKMEELELYFVIFNLLSFAGGWLLSREFYNIPNAQIQELNEIIEEKKNYLKKLEKECSDKQIQLDKLIDESIVCKHKLLQKSNLLRQKNDELYKLEEEIKSLKVINEKDIKLSKTLSNLNETEELIKLRRIIIQKDKLIESMKKAILDRNNLYLRISKDQFHQIELRLKEYKEKIEKLEQENMKLKLIPLTKPKKEKSFFQKINSSLINSKEIALWNIFGNSYNKITKA
jgi:chromosome segregation ATPase